MGYNYQSSNGMKNYKIFNKNYNKKKLKKNEKMVFFTKLKNLSKMIIKFNEKRKFKREYNQKKNNLSKQM